jgi:NADPH2 dehydrogenase
LDPFLDIWGSTSPAFLSGGFSSSNSEHAVKLAEAKGVAAVIMYGRLYTSNPDLPFGLRNGIELTPYNRDDFYRVKSPIGYIDRPFCTEFTLGKQLASFLIFGGGHVMAAFVSVRFRSQFRFGG